MHHAGLSWSTRDTLSPFQIISLWFCHMSNFSNIDQVYTKMHQHLQHQINFIKFSTRYGFIVHLFALVDINIFLDDNKMTLKV